MIEAYVLVQTTTGAAADVALALRSLSGVVGADAVAGPYDVVAKVRGESVDDLAPLVAVEMAGVPGIARTLTCTVMGW